MAALPEHSSTLRLQTLVLLGAGHAHVQVIRALAQSQPAALDVILVSPYDKIVYSGMLPGYLAGHYEAEELQASVAALIGNTRIHWIRASCTAISADERRLLLSDGQTLHYDVLSINTGSAMEAQRIDAQLPGAREQAVFLRPMEKFFALWPRLLRFAQEKPLQISLLGGGAAGVELALALQYRLPQCRISLVAGSSGVLPHYSARVRHKALAALATAQITVLNDQASRIESGVLRLASDASLACDMPWLAALSHAPTWLHNSGLQLSTDGYLQVNAFQQSTSHPEVFAAGDVASQQDIALPKSGVHAVRAGATLINNLNAALCNQKLSTHELPNATLNLISLGSRTAIMSYGFFSLQGAWVWRWKDRIDRRWMKTLTASTDNNP